MIFGASGDLACRKTFPALFSLYKQNLLPDQFEIYGYARSVLTVDQLKDKITAFLRNKKEEYEKDLLQAFFKHLKYIHGAYDAREGFLKLKEEIESVQHQWPTKDNARLFYLALPPSMFIPVATQTRHALYNESFRNCLIVEKPFGRDLQSATDLSSALLALYPEHDIYRIDHYLGKEMVKNLFIVRFGNIFFNGIWNRFFIASVQIVFKETLGVDGRGAYFDQYGIVRDVMQNHLLQMLTVVAMERPPTLLAEDVRDEKIKVLKCIKELSAGDVILGQYCASADGQNGAYIDNGDVPNDSNTPTFAMATLFVDNERWAGVPFILRCGKALNEQKAEIRIQYKDVPGGLFPGVARNELVIRVQPNEAVYMKMMVKKPGLETIPIVSDLDLSYASRYVDLRIPEAYESLLLDALKGDQSNFVREDELANAWRIFTPLLEEIEHVKPIPYQHGSRGPQEADDLLVKLGYVPQLDPNYKWPKQHL